MNRRLNQAVTIGLFLTLSMMHSQPATAESKLVKTTVAYREVHGHDILADVYRPEGDVVRGVIVWIHGGGLIMGHREGIHPQVRATAEEQGYALVSNDYRLAP